MKKLSCFVVKISFRDSADWSNKQNNDTADMSARPSDLSFLPIFCNFVLQTPYESHNKLLITRF